LSFEWPKSNVEVGGGISSFVDGEYAAVLAGVGMRNVTDLEGGFHGPAPLVSSDLDPNLVWRNEARVPRQTVLSTRGKVYVL
jgi:hypothetical protein